jgi:hypothetical protein
MLSSLEDYVRFEIADNLVITENGVLWKKHKILNEELVIHAYRTLADKIYLSEFFTIFDNCMIRLIDSSKHIDD